METTDHPTAPAIDVDLTDQTDLDLYLAPPGPGRAAWCHFDHEWYLLAYPDVCAELEDISFAAVRRHYLEFGRAAGLSPNMLFDEAWYLRRYPEVAAEVARGVIVSGYEHYCVIGFLNQTPHWLYDDELYAANAADVGEAALAEAGCYNLYDHYLKAGAREGRIAHLLFDPAAYRASLRHAPATPNPFSHFLREGWAGQPDAMTSPYFDPAWFRARYPEIAAEIAAGQYCCALHAYLMQPEANPTDPLAYFSEAFYRDTVPEAAEAVASGAMLSGYEHFLKLGVFDLRAPAPGVNLAAFLRDNLDLSAAVDQGRLRDAFAALLLRPPAPAAPEPPQPLATPEPPPPQPTAAPVGHGYLEQFGHHSSARGWLFTGWVSPDLPIEGAAGTAAALRFEGGSVVAEALVTTYPRADLGTTGIGVVGYVPTATAPAGAITSLTLSPAAGADWLLTPLESVRPAHGPDLTAQMMPVLEDLPAGPMRERLTTLARRHFFTGNSTLPLLRDQVFLELEEVIVCPPHGLTLMGWTLSDPGALHAIRLYSGPRCTELRLCECIRHDRPDVRDSVGAKHGLTADLRSGFIAHLADAYTPEATSYLEIETTRGEIAHRGLNAPRLRGMEAIRFLVDRVNVRYGEIPPAFDHVLGPSIAALNADRLRTRPGVQTIAFGPQPDAPAASVIVTLHGRLDFMEYQFGLFSQHTPAMPVEYIYVLDDPDRRWDAENLAASIYQRFRIPLRLLILDRNMGYAPANNIGLAAARGAHVCFMNSDVFPATQDWIERLLARLAENPDLGAVGPLLLFEDGCVQHQGMQFEHVPAMGDWHYPIHTRKGWRPPPEGGLLHAPAITGACIMLRHDLATELGGFDEAYLIGDFEDADLCLKLRARGLACAVDMDTRLYHLERQSQVGPQHRWRMNMTLFNAWFHERRWAAALATLDAGATP